MRIIKNLIIRNSLKKELKQIEHQLYSSDYRALMRKLTSLRFDPDNYAVVYDEIQTKYGALLDRRTKVEAKINKLSGTKIFKKYDDELTK